MRIAFIAGHVQHVRKVYRNSDALLFKVEKSLKKSTNKANLTTSLAYILLLPW